MITAKEIYNKTRNIMVQVRMLLEKVSCEGQIDLSHVAAGESLDELFLLEELKKIVLQLQAVAEHEQYLRGSIRVEGTLKKNEKGCYELEGYEITDGSVLEYLEEGNEWWPSRWKIGTIEYYNGDYYIADASYVNLDEVRARIRY